MSDTKISPEAQAFLEDDHDMSPEASDFLSDSPVEATPRTPMSKMQSFEKGMEQGVTFGHADELAGGVQSGLDKLMSFIPGVKSPNEVNADLKAQGFSGDLGDTYTDARNAARQDYKQAQQDNKYSYLGGNVAGGALTSMAPMGVGAKLMNPVGNVLKGSGAVTNVLAKAGNAALNAAPAGALAGEGMSEANNVGDMAIDAGEGALTSAALGGALNLGGQGVAGAANKSGEIVKNKLPSIYRAYEKGKEGIKTYGDDFQAQTNEKLKETTDKLKNFVLGKRNELAQKNDEIITHLGKQIDNTEKDVLNYRKSLMEDSKTGLEKTKLGYAKQIEAKLLDQKAKVGKTYDVIEDQVANEGLTFNVRDQIANLGEDLQVNGLMPDQAAQIQGRFAQYMDAGDLTLPELKQMKMLANKMMESKNPAIKASFRKMYGQINEGQINTIENAGMKDVANNLRNANQKYTKLLDLEDNFIGDLSKDRVLKKTVTDNDTLSTLDKMVKTDAKSLNSNDILAQKAQNLDPKFGNMVGNMAEDLQGKNAMINNIPSEQQMLSNSGEMQRLQSLLAKAKTKPEIKTQMDQLLQSNEKGINDYLGNNLKNINNPIMEPSRQNIENVLDAYKKSTGKSLNKDASELMKDTELVKNAGEEFHGMISPRSLGAIESTGQYPANMAGRTVKNVKDAAEKLNSNTTTMQNVFKGDIKDVYANMKRFNTPEATAYAKQLETAMSNGTQESKNAVLFSLMQQPAFRQMMNLNKDSNK